MFVYLVLVLIGIVVLAVIMVIVDFATISEDEMMQEITRDWKSYSPEMKNKLNKILDGAAERKRKKK